MCTVTYLPLPGEGFIITSTRDEKTIRKPALPPEKYDIHGGQVYFPRDADAGGTWIASFPGGHTLCLLNGGFVIHESSPPYRRSRGLVLLDFYRYNDVAGFRDQYDFKGIEPFTLLIRNFHGSATGVAGPQFDELRWDGEQLHHKPLDPEIPAIWSSVTLYSAEVISHRNQWFERWLAGHPEFAIGSVVNFHKTAGTGNVQNDILMNRDNVIRTVSITSILRDPLRHEYYYEDMITHQQHSNKILPSGITK
jgi:hypothetical protein